MIDSGVAAASAKLSEAVCELSSAVVTSCHCQAQLGPDTSTASNVLLDTLLLEL